MRSKPLQGRAVLPGQDDHLGFLPARLQLQFYLHDRSTSLCFSVPSISVLTPKVQRFGTGGRFSGINGFTFPVDNLLTVR